jgi:ADP-L-glycero-D-manno-heptose 6-epimerase
MASVVFHAFKQATGPQLLYSSTPQLLKSPTPQLPNSPPGPVRLFRSHRPDYKDGEQLRDFIYVKDVTSVIWFLMNHRKDPGIYNLGTGKARTFLDLATSVFRAMDLEPNIEFIDTPEDIRDKYQYFTEARMEKLHDIGYNRPFTSLEDGIGEYVREYLALKRYF